MRNGMSLEVDPGLDMERRDGLDVPEGRHMFRTCGSKTVSYRRPKRESDYELVGVQAALTCPKASGFDSEAVVSVNPSDHGDPEQVIRHLDEELEILAAYLLCRGCECYVERIDAREVVVSMPYRTLADKS